MSNPRYRSMTTGSFQPIHRFKYKRISDCKSPFGAPTPDGDTVIGTVTTKEIWSQETPSFHACLKRNGFVLPLPVKIVSVSTTRNAAEAVRNRIYNTGTCAGAIYEYSQGPISFVSPRTLFEPPERDEIIRSVVNRACSDARTATYDILTDIAELRSSIDLFRKVGSMLNTHLDDLLKLSLRYSTNPKALAKASSDLWLSYRYGLMPVVFSLQDALKAISKNQNPISIGRATIGDSGSLAKVTETTSNTFDTRTTETLDWNRKYRGFSLAQYSAIISNKFRVDPLTTSYELIRFSFILDWFLDVGTWLEAISPFAAGTTLSTMGSVKTTVVYKQHRFNHSHGVLGNIRYEGDYDCTSLVINEEKYERFYYSPSLPAWNPRLNLPRITDAIALASSLSIKSRHLRI